ncbi:MAG: dihydrolipoamide acetyltransferase family protein [Candidatus Kariarchaeaceae archaeon]|jgi:pyruvate dehydrogenase E2 component (dihydrolipoamide acetyltransferase)
MVYELKFADVGEGVHEGEVLEIYVKVGDAVKVEQELLEVHTEKVTTDITSPVAGTVAEILCEVGETIEVGNVLFKIDTDGASGDGSDEPAGTTGNQVPKEADPSLFKPSTPDSSSRRKRRRRGESAPQQVAPQQIVNQKVLAAPAVRNRARQMDVDLQYVKGSGPAGRITQTDLENYTPGQVAAPARKAIKRTTQLVPGSETRIPLKGTRKTIARAMRHSKDTAAHYTYFEEVDMTALEKLRNSLKPHMEERGIRITYVALVMKCLVPALRKFPMLNGMLDETSNEIILRDYYNIGISVDTEDGLVVPVVKHVEQKSIWEIADEVIDLAGRAREGKLKMDDITGGTFTITSIGNIGGVMATPIIKTPESGILGLMKAKLRPVVINEKTNPEIAIRKMMYLSLSLDHRIVDGAVGARFINELISYMENPALMWIVDE